MVEHIGSNPIGIEQNPPVLRSRSKHTKFLGVALGALALYAAKIFDYVDPGLTSLVRYGIGGAGLVWLCKRYLLSNKGRLRPVSSHRWGCLSSIYDIFKNIVSSTHHSSRPQPANFSKINGNEPLTQTGEGKRITAAQPRNQYESNHQSNSNPSSRNLPPFPAFSFQHVDAGGSPQQTPFHFAPPQRQQSHILNTFREEEKEDRIRQHSPSNRQRVPLHASHQRSFAPMLDRCDPEEEKEDRIRQRSPSNRQTILGGKQIFKVAKRRNDDTEEFTKQIPPYAQHQGPPFAPMLDRCDREEKKEDGIRQRSPSNLRTTLGGKQIFKVAKRRNDDTEEFTEQIPPYAQHQRPFAPLASRSHIKYI